MEIEQTHGEEEHVTKKKIVIILGQRWNQKRNQKIPWDKRK